MFNSQTLCIYIDTPSVSYYTYMDTLYHLLAVLNVYVFVWLVELLELNI